jgi:hypothetical protein
MSLFYIEYGCSICTEHLIIEAKNEDAAGEYAYLSAQDLYWSYDQNCFYEEDFEDMDENNIAEMMEQDMLQDIQYFAEPYNPENEDHTMTMREQNNIPHPI